MHVRKQNGRNCQLVGHAQKMCKNTIVKYVSGRVPPFFFPKLSGARGVFSLLKDVAERKSDKAKQRRE